MSIFDQQIETDDPGMAGGASYYYIEDLYQSFKERLFREMREDSEAGLSGPEDSNETR